VVLANGGERTGRMNRMKVECEICGLIYNDTYRLTFCPHDKFDVSPTARELLVKQGVPPDEPTEDAPRRTPSGKR
jgi:hypothetical protein